MLNAMTVRRIAGAVFSIALLGACDRSDVLLWSPDGNRVGALADHDLRIGNFHGGLGNPAFHHVETFRWLPDFRHAVLVTSKSMSNWNEVKTFLSPREQKRIPAVAERIWRYQGEPEKFEDRGENISPALVYLTKIHGLKTVQQVLKKKYNADIEIGINIDSVDVVEASKPGSFPAHSLYRTINDIRDLRVSPTGKLVAITESANDANKLTAISLTGGASKFIAKSTSNYPDWDKSGNSLIYITTSSHDKAGSDAVHLGSLVKQQVCDAQGLLLRKFRPVRS